MTFEWANISSDAKHVIYIWKYVDTKNFIKIKEWCSLVGHQGLTPVILATLEAEIRKITVQDQPKKKKKRKKWDPILKIPNTKEG
jgi:hypothetical protein